MERSLIYQMVNTFCVNQLPIKLVYAQLWTITDGFSVQKKDMVIQNLTFLQFVAKLTFRDYLAKNANIQPCHTIPSGYWDVCHICEFSKEKFLKKSTHWL